MPARMPSRMSSDRGEIDRRENHDERVGFGRRQRHRDRAAVVVGAGGRDHVDRIRRRWRLPEGRRRGAGACSAENSAAVSPAASHASIAMIPGSAGVGDDADPRAPRQRLRVQARGDVEHLVDRVDANDAGLMEERVDGDVAGRQRGGVTAGGARARPASARLDRHDRLGASDASGDPREPPRVAERFEIEQDDARAGILLPVFQEVVARHVGLVADADERRQAQTPARPPSRESRCRARRSATTSRPVRRREPPARTTRSAARPDRG